eukprot:TRINITY_DN5347_c0_g1_i1.p1 TRINITY_DN5347_c0_g1~~TRINITY_DN5347_c0_g1_i1.p1  ORF type:complete len:340 (+),score=26.67 TRINITY_DN5347_c0_g1_i1:70-1089(+)
MLCLAVGAVLLISLRALLLFQVSSSWVDLVVRSTDVSRKDIQTEVVLAHYNEDLSWTRDFEAPDVHFRVYSKGDRPPNGSTVLPNVGREGHTFLHHIVHEYDHLASWTVFSQAAKPSWGFERFNSDSGHLSDNVEFADYLKPNSRGQDSFFVFSAASHFPAGLQTRRIGMMFRGLPTESKDVCPLAGTEGWEPWWFAADHPHVTSAKPSFLEFYHRYVALDEHADHTRPLTMVFPQGARFAVSRERIHARPRAYYERLLKKLSSDSRPIEGYWLEASWFDVFHPESLQSKVPVCALPDLPAGSALSPWEAYGAVRQRLLSKREISETDLGVPSHRLRGS